MNNRPYRPLLLPAALLLACGGVYAFNGDALPPEAEARMMAEQAAAPLSREEVVAEWMIARRAGTLTPGGEIGETETVLAARDAYNVAQAAEIVARHEAEYAAAVAAAAEAARAAELAAAREAASTVMAALPAADVDFADSLAAREERLDANPVPAAPLPEPVAQPSAEAIKNEEPADTTPAPAVEPRRSGD